MKFEIKVRVPEIPFFIEIYVEAWAFEKIVLKVGIFRR
jgi:hypothetical protein